MLSKKSKTERLRKSREDQFFVVSAAASHCKACTKVCDRFCVSRCGPSRCPAGDAPAAPENFVRQPEKTFSTASVKVRRTQHEHIVFRVRKRTSLDAVGMSQTCQKPTF